MLHKLFSPHTVVKRTKFCPWWWNIDDQSKYQRSPFAFSLYRTCCV